MKSKKAGRSTADLRRLRDNRAFLDEFCETYRIQNGLTRHRSPALRFCAWTTMQNMEYAYGAYLKSSPSESVSDKKLLQMAKRYAALHADDSKVFKKPQERIDADLVQQLFKNKEFLQRLLDSAEQERQA